MLTCEASNFHLKEEIRRGTDEMIGPQEQMGGSLTITELTKICLFSFQHFVQQILLTHFSPVLHSI